jgi:nucleoside-diphosphate-sugar epimerase
MQKKILVTGGAGYIGSILCRILLNEGYYVRVLDRLLFGGESVIELINNENFDFVKGDTRIQTDRQLALKEMDFVIHLAAIVGDPACAQDADLAKETNLEATKLMYEDAELAGCTRFIFASTCSNYGKMSNDAAFVDENSELSPVSLYAETKVAVEIFLLGQDKTNTCKPTCLRFATVYGLSPRMRFDLTVNEFMRDVASGKELVIFGEQFWRPYCHVIDIARACHLVLKAGTEKIPFNVFNVGNTNENYQKKMIADEILKIVPDAIIKYVHRNEDPRDYRVSFDKISTELGFKITRTVPDGLKDIYKVVHENIISDPYASEYKNS